MKSKETYSFNSPPVDQVGVEDRIYRVKCRSIKKETKLEGLKMILNMIDLTTLEGKDTPQKVAQLCTKAMHLHEGYAELPTVAAVCVYPSMVKVAKDALGASPIKVASVTGSDTSITDIALSLPPDPT